MPHQAHPALPADVTAFRIFEPACAIALDRGRSLVSPSAAIATRSLEANGVLGRALSVRCQLPVVPLRHARPLPEPSLADNAP